MPLIDLSHAVEDGMTTYPGLPGPTICDFLSREASAAHYAPGTTFHIGRIDLVANTGTYVDAPFHRFAGGADLAELPLERLAHLDGIVLRTATDAPRAIGPEALADVDVAGRAVLLHTGWARHWRTERYGEGGPFLTAATARELAARGAVFVGTDGLNIDDAANGARPVHTTLLGAGIPIGEHLRGLESLPDAGFRFHAAPVKVRALGTFPVRAYAVVPDGPSA